MHCFSFVSLLFLLHWANSQGQDKLRVTTKLVDPFLMVADSEPDQDNKVVENATMEGATAEPPDGNERYQGFIKDLLDEMFQYLEMEYELQEVKDGFYGNNLNGWWVGMVGEVINKTADIAAAPIIVSTERDDVIDFTYPFMKVEAVVVFKCQNGKYSSLQHLLDADYEFGILEQSGIFRAINTSTDDISQKLVTSFVNNSNGLVENNHNGIEHARKTEKYGFIMEETAAGWLVGQAPCDLEMIKIGLYKRQLAIAVRNQDPLRDKLNEALVYLETGRRQVALRNKWWINQCSSGYSTINLSHILISLALFSFIVNL